MFQAELLHQKGTSETGEETDTPVRRTFEVRALWMWSSKLRWGVRGRGVAAQTEDKRSKTLQMNGTNKCSAVNTTWHLCREAKLVQHSCFFFGLFSWQRLVKWTRLFRLEFNDCSSSYASSSLFCEFCLKAAQSSCKTVGSPSAVLEACSNVNNCSCLTQPLTPEPLGLLKLLIHLSIEKCVFLGGSRIVHRSC